ncbi:MAG: hypothetical protein FWF98_01855 [Dehalococcoidia bacterium]|nr:hypothetical protein [Dehalococcoidia bacterium]
MGFDEDLGKLGASMAGKTSYRFVQREQAMARNNGMLRFIPLLAILVILLPAIALSATPLGRMLWDKTSDTSSNYPYVFRNATQLGTSGAPPVDITIQLPSNAPPSLETPTYVVNASTSSEVRSQSHSGSLFVSGDSYRELLLTLGAYKIVRPVVNDRYASQMALQLGFTGSPLPVLPAGDKRSAYTFINGTQTLEIGLDGSVRLSDNRFWEKPNQLPSNQECIALATKWLHEHNLYPENVVSITASPAGWIQTIDSTTGLITDSNACGTEVAFSVAINGIAIYGGGVSMVIGENGTLLSLQTNMFTLVPAFDVPLKDSDQAFDILKEHLTSPNPPPMENLECVVNYRLLTSLVITGIELNYIYDTNNDYLLPIYLFTGDGYLENFPDEIYPFVGKVDAILH